MAKTHLQLDGEALFTENIPQRVGNDGDDPQVRHLKRLYTEDPKKADRFFDKLHQQHSKKQGFEWLDRVRKKGPPSP